MKVRCQNCFCEYDEQYRVCPFCGMVLGVQPDNESYNLQPGTVLFGRYSVGKVLGFGGFGITYKVWDNKLETILAIKEFYPSGLVYRPPGTSEVLLFSGRRREEFEKGRSRFISEARNMAKFSSHESIVNVFEYFEENNTAYIVMEYLDGISLDKWLIRNGGRLPLDMSLNIALSVGAALASLHAEGILHRDVSPDNIIITNSGGVKLIDFGAARFLGGDERRWTIILKPGFAPPEQYERVNTQGPWTDVYALAATLYLMLTGVKPDESTDRKECETLRPPCELMPEIPEQISNAIMKALELDAALRFSTVEHFMDALRERKRILSREKERTIRRVRVLAGITAALLVTVVCVVALIISISSGQRSASLPDSKLTVWARSGEYDQVFELFKESYPNVELDLTYIDDAEYLDRLNAAITEGNAPTLFESALADSAVLENAAELSWPPDGIAEEGLVFSDSYIECFPEKKQIPTGFMIPVVYVNPTLLEYGGGSVSAIDSLLALSESRSVAVNPELRQLFFAIFGSEWSEYNDASLISGSESFISGETAIYFSDTSSYSELLELIPARFTAVAVESDRALCGFTGLWSISADANKNEKKAAERLLFMMLSDNSQDILRLQSGSSVLPVSKAALTEFSKVYWELEPVIGRREDYLFAPELYAAAPPPDESPE